MNFRLKKSTIEDAGIGVFSTTHIKKGEKLKALFGEDDTRWLSYKEFENLRVCSELKENFAIQYEDGYSVPVDFNCLSIGWYLNHNENTNLHANNEHEYFASRDITPGEELFIDYDKL